MTSGSGAGLGIGLRVFGASRVCNLSWAVGGEGWLVPFAASSTG